MSISYMNTAFFLDGAAQTASDLGIKLDGSSQPFTVAAWVKLNSLPDTSASLLVKEGLFNFSVVGHQLSVDIVGMPGLISDGTSNPINEDIWYYLVCVYDTASLYLYIDGNLDCQAGVGGHGTDNAKPFTMGNNLQGSLNSVRVYNSALSAGAILGAMFEPQSQSASVIASFDFSVNPPADTSGRNLPCALSGSAAVKSQMPAVILNDSAFAHPVHDENVNPGGTGSDAYTIQSWVCIQYPMSVYQASVINPANQVIFVNQSGASGVALFLSPSSSTPDAYHLVSLRGTVGQPNTTLISNAPVALGQWVNAATTYDPASQTLSLYINGQLDNSATTFAPIIPLSSPELLIGGASLPGQPAGVGAFQGYIQSVDVWNICLTAPLVEQWQNGYPVNQAGLTAHFDFGFALARNDANGSRVGLADRAFLGSHSVPASSSSHPVSMPRSDSSTPPEQLPPEEMASIRAGLSFAGVPDLDALLEQAMQKEQADDLSSLVPAKMVPELKARLAAEWTHVRELIRERPLELCYSITYHQLHGDHILIQHTPERSTVVFRAPLESLDACVMWRIQVILTIVSGLLSIFGVTAEITNWGRDYVNRRILQNAELMGLVAYTAPITAPQLFLLIKALYSFGVLFPLIKGALSTLGWWAIGRLLVKLLFRFTPEGTVETIVNLIVAVAQLIIVVSQQPQNCPFIPGGGKELPELPTSLLTA